MKKILLSLFVFGLTLFGFSFATTITFQGQGNGNGYTPSSFTNYGSTCNGFTVNNFTVDKSNIDEEGRYYELYYYSDSFYTELLYYCDEELNCEWEEQSCRYEANYDQTDTYNVMSEYEEGTYTFDSITVSRTDTEQEGGNTGGGNEGGNTGGNEGGILVPGGFSSFTPAVNGLHDTVIELIPYVIYIGIGVLLFMFGFIAVRWLVNRMGGKIKGIFSSKKR